MNKDKKDSYIRIINLLTKYNVEEAVGLLECIKTDIILNTGAVKIDNKLNVRK